MVISREIATQQKTFLYFIVCLQGRHISMMSTNFLFIEWKWTMENADGFTQFKYRNFVVVWTLWNLYDTTTNSTTMKSIPHFIKGSETAIEIPKEGTMLLLLVVKMHLPCITKLSNSGM